MYNINIKNHEKSFGLKDTEHIQKLTYYCTRLWSLSIGFIKSPLIAMA
jgi:hypothetical protein